MRSLVKYFEATSDYLWRIIVVKSGLAFAAVSICLFLLTERIPDPDLFARLAVGRLIDDTGAIPLHDPFSFTDKKQFWIDHEWGSGVVFFQLYSAIGIGGLFFAKLLMALLTLGCIWKATNIRFPSVLNSVPLLLPLSFLFSAHIWTTTVRSQVFTYFFLAVVFLVLSIYEKKSESGRRLIWLLPLLMAVWANLHGGFVSGLGIIAIWAAVGSLRTSRSEALLRLLCLSTCAAASFVTPYGLMYWDYLFDALTMSRPAVDEWDSLELISAHGIFFLLVALLLIFGIYRSRKRPSLEHLCILAVCFFFGLRAYRLQAIFYIAAITYGARSMAEGVSVFTTLRMNLTEKCKRAFSFCSFIFISAGTCLVIQLTIKLGLTGLDFSVYPVAEISHLKRMAAKGNLLIDFNTGSYALWELFPNIKVSLDGRYETVYLDETVDAVNKALTPGSIGHETALAKMDPQYILTSPDRVKKFMPCWAVLEQSERYALLERCRPT